MAETLHKHQRRQLTLPSTLQEKIKAPERDYYIVRVALPETIQQALNRLRPQQDVKKRFSDSASRGDFDTYLCTSGGVENIANWVIQAASFAEPLPAVYRVADCVGAGNWLRRKRLVRLAPATEFLRAIYQAEHLKLLQQHWTIEDSSFPWWIEQKERAAEMLLGFKRAERCGRVPMRVKQ
jgi:hypothetical protein